MNNKRIRLIIIGWVVVSVVLIIIVLLIINRDKLFSQAPLEASEVVAVNIQEFDSLNPINEASKAFFFTGTNLATISMVSKDSPTAKTESITKNAPTTNTTSVSRSGTTLLYKGVSSLSAPVINQTIDGGVPNADGTETWFISTADAVRVAPFSDPKKAVDAVAYQDKFYVLELSGTSYELATYDKDNQRQLLTSGVTAVDIVGVVDNFVVMRDYFGKLFVWNGQAIKQIAEKAGDAYLDIPTKSVLYSEAEEHEIGEEGGSIVKEGKENNSVSVFGLSNSALSEIKPNFGNIYYSGNGKLIASSSVSKPTDIEVIDIATKEVSTYEINQNDNIVSNQIASIRMVSDKPATFWAITNNNMVTVWSDKEQVENLAPHAYPRVPRLQGEYIFGYSIGRNSVQIVPYSDLDNLVERSLVVLRQGCKCDINQMSKTWLVEEQ